MSSIKSYHVKHRLDLRILLTKAKLIANYAVANKKNKKLLTSKYVKEFGLPSVISNQILRKYGRGSIKEAKNINLILINQHILLKMVQ
jgi:putative transposase